ncbi:hypothetical protein ACFE04_011723 [Oxalis oulophora]
MASLFLPFVLVVIISSTIISFAINPDYSNSKLQVTEQDLTQLCTRTQDPPYCTQILLSDNRTNSSDFRGLAQISIDIAESISTGALTMIGSLEAQATDPEIKDRYEKCSINYNALVGFLDGAKQKLSSADFDGVYNFGARGGVEASSCEARFDNSNPIFQMSHNLGTLTKFLSEIAIYLLAHKLH